MGRAKLAAAIAAITIYSASQAVAGDAPAPAPSRSQPLWEVEALGIAAYTPDYPGSDQMHAHGLALPWLTYRGNIIRSDDRGSVSGKLLKSGPFALDVSAQGSFPTSSDDNRARADMPDLDWLGEIGPRLKVTVRKWSDPVQGRRAVLNFELPVRAALSTDLKGIDYRGVVAHPALAYDNSDLFGARVKLLAGPVFVTQELADYFYGVSSAYSRPDRPTYDAEAGYLGTRAGLRVSAPLGGRVTLLGQANVDFLQGTTNEDSPLVKEQTNVGVMMGLSVSLWRSEAKIAASE